MNKQYLLLLVAAVCFCTFAASAFASVAMTTVERDTPIAVPAAWERVSKFPVFAQSQRKIDLLFAVKHRNVELLEKTFWEVSDPDHANYGKHLSLDEMTAMVGPEQSTVDEIVLWLKQNGVENVYVNQGREFISASVSVPTAIRLFKLQFHTYKHKTGLLHDSTLGPYTVPVHIAEKIDFVTGLIGFPDVSERSKVRVNPAPSVGKDITPAVIRARYNVSEEIISVNPKNGHAVAEFQAQYYSQSDLEEFWKKFVKDAPFIPVQKVIGYNDETSPGIEASLDIQYIMGVAPNVTTWFYSMKSFDFWSDLTRWTKELADEKDLPWVHSVSYGEQGNYPSEDYRDRLNEEFQKLGARGLSVIFASGDSGAGCAQGTGSTQDCDCEFYPSFPADCPYITSVGATRFLQGTEGDEGAVETFKSGGGYSQIFPTQDYQADVVNAYQTNAPKLPEPCAYNASGRATPDVAALGDTEFQVVNGGQTIPIGGTSASAPAFSAIISLLNEILLNNGQSTLGFLNPWLYKTAASTPGAFFDVTVGDNTTPDCCKSKKLGGFDCAPGWDPVTGLGTPNYAVLAELVNKSASKKN